MLLVEFRMALFIENTDYLHKLTWKAHQKSAASFQNHMQDKEFPSYSVQVA